MKKLSRYIILIGAIILFFALSPRFLALETTQEYIAEKLGKNLNSTVSIKNIRWKWLPVPHISLTGTTILNEGVQVTLPKIKIHPHWRMLYTSELLPENFNLENPQISLKIDAPEKENNSPPFTIPGTSIQIKNGTLKIHADAVDGIRETVLNIGYADIDISKTESLLSININKLVAKAPRLKLSGTIEKRISQHNKNQDARTEIPEPVWILNLNGRDLDLTGIRQGILALWKDNEVAQTVSDIVLAGKAKTAAYRFSGSLEDFNDLDNMVIEAEPFEASLHVPGAELDLTNAAGPILIKDSVLTGENLSAQMGESFGSKGEIFLDLAEEKNGFTLNLDIDADLKALPPVLEQLVGHKGFLHELSRFKNVSGRAFGNLQLGETLGDIITRVDVETMKFSTDYEPIPQTVLIDKGILHVRPEEVSWKNVKGRIGLQKITGTSGIVSWKTGETLLHIEEMQGQLDGESLYAMLEQTDALPEKIKKNLLSINGGIDVSGGSVKGSAMQPETWKYEIGLQTKGLTFSSPLLPEPVTVNKLSAAFNNAEANIQQTELLFFDQPLNLKGSLQHQKLEEWHGKIELNGPLHARLADWISSKGWFSENMRPRTPCTMENLNINFQGDTIGISGKILSGSSGDLSHQAKIVLENTPEQLHIKELTFYAPGEQGSLSLDLQRQSPRNLTVSWQGFINAHTVEALFEQNVFVDGAFSGAFFEISYFADQPEKTRFKGLLKIENLLLKNSSGEKEPIVFQNILLSGTGKQLKLNELDIDIGSEKISGSGHLTTKQEGLDLDIDLTSSFISKKSLDDLTLGLKETQNFLLGTDTDKDKDRLIPRVWDMTGRIGLNFESFSARHEAPTLYNKNPTVLYTLYDMRGELQLAPDNISRTEIFSSKLCDLDFQSTWYSDEALGQQLTLGTSSNNALRLENVLPCLGVDQDLLEGEFTLQANLRKESGIWHAGNIHLKSTKGRILRLKLLSRIFKIVNITDLFVTQVGSSGKKGFPYSRMDIDSHINEDYLMFDRAILHGEGLNLFLQGDIHLSDYDADLTLLVAPFKTFDSLVSKVPIIGKPIMSEYDSLVAIPVAIKGPLPDPAITPLQLKAVSGALFNVVKETFKLPYNILKPKENPDM
jgi:hypothetical protein